jgi:hypothetical protein
MFNEMLRENSRSNDNIATKWCIPGKKTHSGYNNKNTSTEQRWIEKMGTDTRHAPLKLRGDSEAPLKKMSLRQDSSFIELYTSTRMENTGASAFEGIRTSTVAQ